jgi:cytochrome c553
MKKYIITLLIILSSLTLFAETLELYKKCAGCHGENGELSALQQSAAIGGQESNLTIKELTAYKNGELNQYGLGNIMKLQLSALSQSDIEELAQYIANIDVNASK